MKKILYTLLLLALSTGASVFTNGLMKAPGYPAPKPQIRQAYKKLIEEGKNSLKEFKYLEAKNKFLEVANQKKGKDLPYKQVALYYLGETAYKSSDYDGAYHYWYNMVEPYWARLYTRGVFDRKNERILPNPEKFYLAMWRLVKDFGQKLGKHYGKFVFLLRSQDRDIEIQIKAKKL